MLAMTGGLGSNPPWFPLLFVVGGVVGASGSLLFATAVEGLVGLAGVSATPVAAAAANGGTGRSGP